MALTEDFVLDALRAVIDPDLHTDIVKLGFVKNIVIDGNSVRLTLELTTPACPVRDLLKIQSEEAVLGIRGVETVDIEVTSRVRERPKKSDLMPGVKHLIAIASGKGGVGKSTCTVNLAVALAQAGSAVGILDADVYGPTIPLLMGSQGERPHIRDDKIIPLEKFGIRMMSLGFLLEDGKAVLWRGPMVSGTVKQLLADVDWGDLDYLLVDLPPGTGDAPMTLADQAPLTGVVIVSTPHNVASNIAGKSVQLFQRLGTPILGVVENMGPYFDEASGQSVAMFAGAGGEALATHLETPYLGSIPFDPLISASGDDGVPGILAHPNRPQAEAFRKVAGKLAQQVSIASIVAASEKPQFTPVSN
jgi:ATP-binding protein involved in chromosome partitioning